MAERRMFAKSIVLSDAFLDMPLSARCLYFTLGMLADDDGFVGNPKSIMRQCGASQDDMLALLQKRYVLAFDSGVIVIKHWKINNYLRGDRYNETTYLEEKDTLGIDGKGAYIEKNKPGIPPGIPTVYPGKDSIDKNSIEKNKENIVAQKSVQEQADEMYERLWKLYPNKKGKKHVSDKQKRELLSIGEEVIKKCLDRYIAEQNEKKELGVFCPEWQHGSTFFNSGYVDYLDENYLAGTEQSTEEIPKELEAEPINLMDVDDETFYKLKNGNAL